MKVIWTRKAENQLDQIFNYIKEDSVFYAYRTVQQIIETAEGVTEHPRKGRLVPELEREDIHEVFSFPYSIIYLLTEDQIQILSVIHDRRLLYEKSI